MVKALGILLGGAKHLNVPVGRDGAADEDLEPLDGEVGNGQDGDEDADALGEEGVDGKDPGHEKEERDLGAKGCRAVHGGANVEPLRRPSTSVFFFPHRDHLSRTRERELRKSEDTFPKRTFWYCRYSARVMSHNGRPSP